MHLDLNVLRGFLRDVKTQEHVLLEFGSMISDTRGRVVAAVSAGELDVVRAACHALKSSSRSVGATELGRLSEQLEAIGAGRTPDPIEPALACFLDQCSAVEHELAERISELG